jgi:hypothetical protein
VHGINSGLFGKRKGFNSIRGTSIHTAFQKSISSEIRGIAAEQGPVQLVYKLFLLKLVNGFKQAAGRSGYVEGLRNRIRLCLITKLLTPNAIPHPPTPLFNWLLWCCPRFPLFMFPPTVHYIIRLSYIAYMLAAIKNCRVAVAVVQQRSWYVFNASYEGRNRMSENSMYIYIYILSTHFPSI